MNEEKAPDFCFFISSLAIQASIALGLMPNPVSGNVEENLPHAKLIVNTLLMLKEKTQGNLNTEEDSLLDKFIHELQAQYAGKKQGA